MNAINHYFSVFLMKGMEYKRILKLFFSFLILCTFFFFFFRAFQKNWTIIESYDFKFKTHFVLLSFTAIILSYLLTTYGWFFTLNRLSGKKKITFSETIAVVNTSGLTKYIPGKVWSYALQMYWLVKAGFSKSLILYVNLITIAIALITTLMLGISYLAFSPGKIPLIIIIPSLLLLLIFDIAVIKFSSTFFNWLIPVVNKFFKRDIQYYNMSTKLLLYLHGVHIVSAFCFGMGAYFIYFGIGLVVANGSMFLVMASLMISDVIGFLAFFVPGGLGVREGVMYLMLQGISSGALPLVLPIATRIVSMLVDLCGGTTGFILLKSLKK